MALSPPKGRPAVNFSKKSISPIITIQQCYISRPNFNYACALLTLLTIKSLLFLFFTMPGSTHS